MDTAGEVLIRETKQQVQPHDTTSILLATARDDSSLVRLVSNASRLHSVSSVHACCSGCRCWGEVSNGDPTGPATANSRLRRSGESNESRCRQCVQQRWSTVLRRAGSASWWACGYGCSKGYVRQTVVSSNLLLTRQQGTYVQTEVVCDELDESTERRRSVGPSFWR